MFEFSFEIIYWYILLELLGLITFPIAFFISRINLHDKGYAISKILSILFLTYSSWILVSLTPLKYDLLTILISLGIILAVSCNIFRKEKNNLIAFFNENKKLILTYELFFLIAFLFFVGVRYYDSSILDAEKYQDFMILNGLLRTGSFPLNDPWFNGYPLQYYYFGHLFFATLTKLTAINPAITYNLSLATIFALTLILSFSILYNLTKKISFGFIGSLLVGITGNFRAIIQIILEGKILPFNYWPSAHWIIPGTINEFPYWSFLHADLHAHVIAIPFTILALILILNNFLSREKSLNFKNIAVLSLSIGALSVINAWDYPTYLGISFLSIILREIFLNKRKINFFFLKNSIIYILIISFLSFVLFLPYHLSFRSLRPISFVTKGTEIQYYFIIYALFLFIIFTFLLFQLKKYRITFLGFYISDIVVLLTLIAILILKSLVYFLLILILFVLFLLLRNLFFTKKNEDRSYIFSLILILTALILSLGIEFIYIDDAFVGDLERVNTVFKIGMQIWILYAIAGGYALYFLKKKLFEDKPFTKLNFSRYLLLLGFIVLLLTSLLFFFLATVTKTENNYNFFGKTATLDGMNYLKNLNFCDYDAITWINKNIHGTPVILEAPGDSFKWQSCVSANTGLPTVLGWEGHEKQWRPKKIFEIMKRKSDIDKIYSNLGLSGLKRTVGGAEITLSGDDWKGINWDGDALLSKVKREAGMSAITSGEEEGINEKALKISAKNGANANFRKKIRLDGNSHYKLTAWIKTKNLEKVGDVGKIGQILIRKNLNDAPGEIIAESFPLVGNNYWTKVEIEFFVTPGEDSVWITSVLGNWGKARGEILFDGFKITKEYDEKTKKKDTGETKKPNFDEVFSLIKKYNINYIYVGKLERERYSIKSVEKFNELFKTVYESKNVMIYKT